MKIKQIIIKTDEGETDLFFYLQELDRRLTLLQNQFTSHIYEELDEE